MIRSSKTSRLWMAARIVLGLAVAATLVGLTLRNSGSDLGKTLRQAAPLLLLAATGMYAGVLLITTLRWQWLLRVQDIHFTFVELIRLTLIGAFFNLAIPGAVGGDLVKISYLSKLAGPRNTEAILSVAMDRFLGLLGLLLVALVSVLFSLPFLLQLPPEYELVRLGAFAVGLASFGGVLVIILFRYQQALLRHRWIQYMVSQIAPKLPKAVVTLIQRLQRALAVYGHAQRVLWSCIAVSIASHCLLAGTVIVIGRALPGDKLAVAHAFVATQVANAVSSIPLTPAGIGTRDATLSYYLRAMQLSPEKSGSMPLILSMIILVWGLVGAVVFAVRGSPQPLAAGTSQLNPP